MTGDSVSRDAVLSVNSTEVENLNYKNVPSIVFNLKNLGSGSNRFNR